MREIIKRALVVASIFAVMLTGGCGVPGGGQDINFYCNKVWYRLDSGNHRHEISDEDWRG